MKREYGRGAGGAQKFLKDCVPDPVIAGNAGRSFRTVLTAWSTLATDFLPSLYCIRKTLFRELNLGTIYHGSGP